MQRPSVFVILLLAAWLAVGCSAAADPARAQACRSLDEVDKVLLRLEGVELTQEDLQKLDKNIVGAAQVLRTVQNLVPDPRIAALRAALDALHNGIERLPPGAAPAVVQERLGEAVAKLRETKDSAAASLCGQ